MVIARLKKLKDEFNNSRQRERESQRLLNDDTEVKIIEVKQVKDIMNNYQELLDKASLENKKMLLLLLINQITINDRKKIDTIEIKFNENLQKYLLDIKG